MAVGLLCSVLTWQTCLEGGYLGPVAPPAGVDPGDSELVGSAGLQLQLLGERLLTLRGEIERRVNQQQYSVKSYLQVNFRFLQLAAW